MSKSENQSVEFKLKWSDECSFLLSEITEKNGPACL